MKKSQVEKNVREEGRHGFEVGILGSILLGVTLGLGGIELSDRLISSETALNVIDHKIEYSSLSLPEKIGYNMGVPSLLILGTTAIAPFIVGGPLVGTYYENRARRKYQTEN